MGSSNNIKVAIVISKPAFHDYMPPLGYLYVSSVVKKTGADARLFPCDSNNDSCLRNIRKSLEEYKPNVLITGTSYKFHNNCPSPTIKASIQATKCSKKINSSCITVLIGPLNSMIYEQLLSREPSIDYVVLGEPENICFDLCKALIDNKDLTTVPGLAMRDGNSVVLSGKTSFPDLNEMPFPDRDSIDMSQYITDSYFAKRTTHVLSSRGCPFACTYCFGAFKSRRNQFNTGTYYRSIEPEKVVREIDLLYGKWKVRGIKFADVEFCVSQNRVRKICELLISKGYKDLFWRAVTRVTSLNLDLMKLMHRAGCRHIYYGVESGDPRMLKLMNKQIDLTLVRETFRNTWKCNIKPEAAFLLGIPGETEESVKNTLRFVDEINPFLATFHVFVPFPGILLEKENKISIDIDLDQWNVYHAHDSKSYCELSAERLHELSKHAYRHFFTRPRFLYQRALNLTNPQMIKFLVNSIKGKNEGSIIRKLFSEK